jgi:biopolymer transport protein ExbB
MDWLLRAGWMAWPLGACAVGALALFFERWVALSPSKLFGGDWRRDALQALREQRDVPASKAAAQSMIEALVAGDDKRIERVHSAGQRLVAEMERGVSWLATIAALAPLLGLTGTVIGMIDVFQRISEMGGGDASVLAGGIWMALVTTVLGMLVAMPTLILHRLLQGRLTARVNELEGFAEELLEAAK